MRLTKFSDLALRVVMYLSAIDPAEQVTTREVATAVDAPYHHVAKVVGRLQRLGMLEARRGRGGGLAVTQTGRSRSVGSLVRELEGDGEVASCEDGQCPLRAACGLRGALRTAQNAFYASLDTMVVADLASAPTRTVLLGLPTRSPD